MAEMTGSGERMSKNRLKIIVMDCMVNIDSEDLSYGNIQNMYNGHDSNFTDGHGIQLNPLIESKERELLELCDTISSSIYKITAILNRTPSANPIL